MSQSRRQFNRSGLELLAVAILAGAARAGGLTYEVDKETFAIERTPVD